MRSMRRAVARRSVAFLLAARAGVARLPAQTLWLQFDFDARHSGVNPFEGQIPAANVANLGVIFNVSLPAVADGAPGYLSGVSTASGLRDLLFVTTKDRRLVAVDALTGVTVWSRQPATGPGITTSSPAIDPNRQFVYSYGLDGRVQKYRVGDGSEVSDGGWPEVATLKPSVEKGSSALTIATVGDGSAVLFVANSGYLGDAGDYQGHITAIQLATGAQQVFNTLCSDQVTHFVQGGSPDCATCGAPCGRARASSTTRSSTRSSSPPAMGPSTRSRAAMTGGIVFSLSTPTAPAPGDRRWTPTHRPTSSSWIATTSTSAAPRRRCCRARRRVSILTSRCKAARTACSACSISTTSAATAAARTSA